MGITTNPANTAGGPERDSCDFERLRHARDRSLGFPIGQYMQPAPMLFTRDGHNVFLGDMYRGRSAFLVCGGPSLTSHDLALLNSRGILTMAVNNAATIVRPNLWCSVDDPGNFSDAIWYDAGITKFVPFCHMEKTFTVRSPHGELMDSTDKVGDMPAVFGFRRNEAFVAEQFLTEDTFNWGNHGNRLDNLGNKGSRSVMYVAIRLLHYLGIRTIYLIGCDFKMQTDTQNYAFQQGRTSASVRGNNDSYRIMNDRFTALLPHFEQAGLEIYNCTPESGLKPFPRMSYEEAIEAATAMIPKRINTEGMYDRKSQQKKTQSRVPKSSTPTVAVDTSACLPDLPEMTLVVPIDEHKIGHFRESWRTWAHLKPWISQLPILILRHPKIDESAIAEVLGSEHKARMDVMQVDDSLPQAWERSKVIDIPGRIDTEWYWMLEPSAVATSKLDWIAPPVFERDETNREPVFMACNWRYTKPAQTYARLDTWANGVDLFRDHPPLNWPIREGADRIEHDAISSWSFLASTSWAREIASVVDREAPIIEHSTFMLFCAERQRNRFSRIPMKRFGWDHSFGWDVRKIRNRCQEVLAGK